MTGLMEALGGAYLDLQSGENVDDAATNKEIFVNDPDTTYKSRNTTTDAFLQKRTPGRGIRQMSSRGANACYEDINESDEINDKTYNYGKKTQQNMSQLAGQGEMYNSIANGEEVTADNLYVRRNRLKERLRQL